jgi:hypothetical protein
MVGADVKQTRCTTCETEHEYKQAKVPRQRRKADTPAALYAQVAATAPKRAAVPHDLGSRLAASEPTEMDEDALPPVPAMQAQAVAEDDLTENGGAESSREEADGPDGSDAADDRDEEEGPVHRQLIRASLPREGQPPVARPIPEFTIRQPTGGRPSRFRPHQQHARGQEFQGNRSNGNGPGAPRGGGGPRPSGRPPQGGLPARLARRHGPGRKRSK